MANAAPERILVVDDHPLVRDGLRSLLAVTFDTCDILEAAGVEEACAVLAQHGDCDLVLLDLNMPRKDGREVLAEVKADRDLRTIPVVVLTTSSAAQDIRRSYQLHANAYVTKPTDFDEFATVVHCIERFFGRIVQLPRSA